MRCAATNDATAIQPLVRRENALRAHILARVVVVVGIFVIRKVMLANRRAGARCRGGTVVEIVAVLCRHRRPVSPPPSWPFVSLA